MYFDNAIQLTHTIKVFTNYKNVFAVNACIMIHPSNNVGKGYRVSFYTEQLHLLQSL